MMDSLLPALLLSCAMPAQAHGSDGQPSYPGQRKFHTRTPTRVVIDVGH
jgi:hypothetical protein